MSHQTISFVKSAWRQAGYLGLLFLGYCASLAPGGKILMVSAGLLIVSEAIGIYEEIGH